MERPVHLKALGWPVLFLKLDLNVGSVFNIVGYSSLWLFFLSLFWRLLCLFIDHLATIIKSNHNPACFPQYLDLNHFESLTCVKKT